MPDIFWPWFWGVIVLIGAAMEARALFRKRFGDTLSEQVWKLLWWGDKNFPKASILARMLLVAGGLWLGLHFAFSGGFA